jgi:predicted 2-oxoglutarate/Fe(II)-dependent dioxygenase YbiX
MEISPDAIEQYLTIKKAVDYLKEDGDYALDRLDVLPLPDISTLLCKLQDVPVLRFDEEISKDVHILIDGTDVGPMRDIDVETIRKYASPAPFGKGGELVYDSEVRDAYHVDGDRITITKVGSITDESRKSEVSKEMAKKAVSKYNSLIRPIENILARDGVQQLAPIGYMLVPKLYKMHIYECGGFFHSHVDTSHGPTHLATLVVELPTHHQGGELVVYVDQEREYSDEKVRNADGAAICTAFYTTCKHRVLPVTKGTRVVLQYDLYAEALNREMCRKVGTKTDIFVDELFDVEYAQYDITQLSRIDKVHLTVENIELLQELARRLKDTMAETRKPCALPLRHRYTASGLRFDLLKGIDQMLYLVLAQHFVVELLPIIICVNHYDEENEYYLTVLPFDEKHIQQYTKFPYNRWFVTLEEELQHREHAPIFAAGPKYESLDKMYEIQYNQHTGNEAQCGKDGYLNTVLLVYPPSKK